MWPAGFQYPGETAISQKQHIRQNATYLRRRHIGSRSMIVALADVNAKCGAIVNAVLGPALGDLIVHSLQPSRHQSGNIYKYVVANKKENIHRTFYYRMARLLPRE